MHIRSPQSGEAGKDLLVVVGLVVLLGFFWLLLGGPIDSQSARGGPWMKAPPPAGTGSTFGSKSAWIAVPESIQMPPSTPGAGFVSTTAEVNYLDYLNFSLGNAGWENRANREYLTIRLSSAAPRAINLTGWYITGERYRSVERIGTATRLFGYSAAADKPVVAPIFLPVILEPGGEAIVVSGNPPRVETPVPGSFLENACTGYIEDNDENRAEFTPNLETNCPDPDEEPGIRTLADRCYDVARSWPRCETVLIESEDGVRYLNGWPTRLNQDCRDYLKEHFSYEQCLRWHVNDPDFFGQTWRIFLNHGNEMFAKNRETVRIYDNEARLIFEQSYD